MTMQKIQLFVTGSVVFIAAVVALAFAYSPRDAQREADDREEIINHIHGIFQAFIEQDEEGVRARHTKDWIGFQSGSRSIVKGIDAYMQNTNALSGGPTHMIDYEIEDIEVQLFGDIAHVYYVANWQTRVVATGMTLTVRARSLDIYRRYAEGWNQAGAHLAFLPRAGSFSIPVCAQQCRDVTLFQE